MKNTVNTRTSDEARDLFCPVRMGAGAADTHCSGQACMAWRVYDDGGFEEHEERSLDWRATFCAGETNPDDEGFEDSDELGHDDEKVDFGGLRLWLSVQIGEGKANAHIDGYRDGTFEPMETIDPDSEEYDADVEQELYWDRWHSWAGAIDALLSEKLEAEKDAFAELKRPIGDHWGLQRVGVRNGVIVARYQRPTAKRGYCGAYGRLDHSGY